MFSILSWLWSSFGVNPEKTVSHSFPKSCTALQKKWWIGRYVSVGVGFGALALLAPPAKCRDARSQRAPGLARRCEKALHPPSLCFGAASRSATTLRLLFQ